MRLPKALWMPFTFAAWLLCGASMAAHEPASEEAGTEEMAAARERLYKEHGGDMIYMVLGDRLEYRSDDTDETLLWDLQGWYGGDLERLWIKTEGDYSFGTNRLEEAELQALYSRAVSTYFDLQLGVRHDFEPSPSRSYAVLGFQGLAPQWFEVEAALFVSENSDLSGRVEAEYDLLLTQRLFLEPRAELEFAAQDVPGFGIGSGLSSTELGVRLRYEVRREFAPYVGFSWTGAAGETSDLMRAAGEPTSSSSIIAGFRFWY